MNDVELPESWVERAVEGGMGRGELRERVESGWFFLTHDGGLLRRGFTTGTSATAAAKAAALSVDGEAGGSVEVPVPCGLRVEIPVEGAEGGVASVVKDSGDHGDDVTGGTRFFAEVEAAEEFSLSAGEGVGVATETVGRLVEGRAAINPSPREQIEEAVREVGEFAVEVSVEGGAELAGETKNSVLGVEGGISILGTTGFVEPWCRELRDSLEERAEGVEGAVVTTGRMGAMYAGTMFPERPVFVFGKHVGRGLETVDGEPVLASLPGLLLKWGAPELLEEAGFDSWSAVMEAGRRDVVEEGGRRAVGRARGLRPGAEVVVMNWSGEVLYDSREDGEV